MNSKISAQSYKPIEVLNQDIATTAIAPLQKGRTEDETQIVQVNYDILVQKSEPKIENIGIIDREISTDYESEAADSFEAAEKDIQKRKLDLKEKYAETKQKYGYYPVQMYIELAKIYEFHLGNFRDLNTQSDFEKLPSLEEFAYEIVDYLCLRRDKIDKKAALRIARSLWANSAIFFFELDKYKNTYLFKTKTTKNLLNWESSDPLLVNADFSNRERNRFYKNKNYLLHILQYLHVRDTIIIDFKDEFGIDPKEDLLAFTARILPLSYFIPNNARQIIRRSVAKILNFNNLDSIDWGALVIGAEDKLASQILQTVNGKKISSTEKIKQLRDIISRCNEHGYGPYPIGIRWQSQTDRNPIRMNS